MTYSIYHNPRCTKSRQGLAFLKEKGIEPEVIEYLKEIPAVDELKLVLAKLGMKPLDLVRKGEAYYKDHYKGKDLNDEEWIDAMIAYPKLIERPIIINGNKAVIGRPTEKILELM